MDRIPFQALLENVSFLLVILIVAPVLGVCMASLFEIRIYQQRPKKMELAFCRLCGFDPREEMDWIQYAKSMLTLNGLGFLLLFVMLIFQDKLPWNPHAFPGLSFALAFNIAASFSTNTDWQSYAGETTLSYFSQMVGLTVQNFLSASIGFCAMLALIRGIASSATNTLGNFWCDFFRTVTFIFLPLSFILALILIQQGVIQTLNPPVEVTTLEQARQVIPVGPAASQVAIKQLGTNGGGFFNANGAHPFENPTPFTNGLEILAIVLVPVASCFTYGLLLKSRRHALMIFFTLLFLLSIGLFLALYTEYVRLKPYEGYLFLEGKEMRNGVSGSVLWNVLSAASANGSVNASLDSMAPLTGGLVLFFILLREVVFGGIGTGLCTLTMFMLPTVFYASLMVGHSPHYLGKKIHLREIQWAMFGILIPSVCIILGTIGTTFLSKNEYYLHEHGPHALTQILFASASTVANNGSAFAGFTRSLPIAQIGWGVLMIIGRLAVLIPTLIIAGSLAGKIRVLKTAAVPDNSSPLFAFLLVSIILSIVLFLYFPFLCLGPMLEHILVQKGTVF